MNKTLAQKIFDLNTKENTNKAFKTAYSNGLFSYEKLYILLESIIVLKDEFEEGEKKYDLFFLYQSIISIMFTSRIINSKSKVNLSDEMKGNILFFISGVFLDIFGKNVKFTSIENYLDYYNEDFMNKLPFVNYECLIDQ